MLVLLLTSNLAVALKIQPIKVRNAVSASLFLDPSSQTVALGPTFTVNVSIAEVSNLDDHELKLGYNYNSTVIDRTQVQQVPFEPRAYQTPKKKSTRGIVRETRLEILCLSEHD